MTKDECEELISVIASLSGICEELTQKVVALENTLPQPSRAKYEQEIRNLAKRAPLTNLAVGLDVLRQKILPG